MGARAIRANRGERVPLIEPMPLKVVSDIRPGYEGEIDGKLDRLEAAIATE